jgi:hypothetical protein
VKYTRIGSVTAAALILTGCGGGSHSGSGTSAGSGTSSAPPTSTAPAFDMDHIETAAVRQIESDQRGHVLQGETHVKCPTNIQPQAGTKFECSIDATRNGADKFTGTATIVLNDPAGKTFSLDYKMSMYSRGRSQTLSGTDPSVS